MKKPTTLDWLLIIVATACFILPLAKSYELSSFLLLYILGFASLSNALIKNKKWRVIFGVTLLVAIAIVWYLGNQGKI
ncbi:MAG: hypothetical protein ACK5M7_20085 [Draconibacterium sp.]